jgi:hypothetical protein
LVPLFGESQRNPSENKERGGALALGGRQSFELSNNQPKVGGSVRGDDIAEAGGEDSVGGYTVQSFGAANGTMKK